MTEPRLVKRMRLGFVALLACGLFPSFAYGWHDPAWAYRQEITILPTLADSNLSGFPYLVKITDGANPVFANALANGDDIVFTSSDGSTQVAHELEKYDSNTNELYAWVRVPAISSTVDTVIYMYYGNGSVTASEEDVEGTWDSDFVDVQHLQETSGTHFDSTSNNNDGTPLNGVIQNATGQIDGANQFDGSNDKVDTADSASLRVVEMTVEAWVYVPSSIPAGFDGIVVHAPSTNNWYGLWKNSNRFHFRWSTGSVRRTDFNSTFLPNQWYYVAGVLDVGADEVRTYQNDTLDTTVNGPSAPSPTAGPLYIGHTFSSSEFFPGFIDEVRISRIARSDAWIKASARNQGTPDTYQNLAPEESDSCAITTTVDSLTPGSLRACIIEANTNPGADTITVPAGTYNLTLDDDLVITEQLTINGAGQATTIIDGQALDRVFDIEPGITVSMSDLTIRNGDIGGGDGGGIRNQGNLTLTNATVRDSDAGKGGGIHSQGATTALTFVNVTVTNNTADNGAGIYLKDAGVTLTMTGGSITNNTTGGSGGGIYNERGNVTLTNVTVSGNTAKVGGGVWSKEVEALLDITNSPFSQNTATDDGGAIYNDKGSITIDTSTFDNNTGTRDGGALYSKNSASSVTITDSTFSSNQTTTEDGGAIYFEDGTLTVDRVTLNSNDAARDGGGLWTKNATTTLTNVTISDNTATGDEGGGIRAENGTVRLNNATLTGNSAGFGGGIFVQSDPVILFNTIIANSPTGGNCSGTITSLGTNLDSANTCGLTGPGDLINSNPSLGSLLNNGGPTQTHALFAGSPAIDTGNNLGCPAIDQRGVVRPINGTCDIGAYEAPAAPPGPPVCQVDPSGTYIEAENFTGTIVQGATFAVESTTPGFNGSGYLRSTGGSTSSPPVNEGKIYSIDFGTSGTYNVWMRGYALDSGSDSAFIGLNGTSTGALNEGGSYNTWVWSNGVQTGSNQITVPATGFHDFNTWVREPNHRIDGFYLTQYGETPTGGIPSGTPTLDPTQCVGADLALTKTDSADPVSVGNGFEYNLLVINNGPFDATNVTLVDTLPADVDFQSATPSQGLCVHSGEPLGGTVTCTLGTIVNGAGATLDIDVVAPGTTGVINNSATVKADQTDPDESNNTATEDTTIVDPSANLSVTMAEDFDPAGINLPYVYTVTVTNPGPANATLVTLVDTLPGTVTYQSAVPSQGVCAEAGGIVTCDLGDLTNGSNATIDITVIAPATPQTVTNTAVVSAAEPDPDLSDNTWEEDTDVVDPPPADLELTKIDVPDPVIGGNPLTYTLTINNLGSGTATLVQLTDTLPASVIYVSATPSQGSCSETGGTVDCALGTLVSGASATVVIVVTAPVATGSITNSASVSAVQSDPNLANNSASVDTEITTIGEADLSLSQSDSPDPVNVNQTLSYSLVVDNLGPDDATDVVLVDTLPATVTFQSAISSQGICSETGGTVTCTLGLIVGGADATVDIIVTAPPSAGSITNNASVSTSAIDSDPADDNASEITTVQNLNVNQLCYLVADAGGSGGGNDLLTSIDTADFDPLTNETNIGIGTGTNSIEAIAWNSSTSVLYGANGGRLGTLNTITGVFSPLPQTFGTGSGANGNITFTDVDGLTYDPTSGVLYGSERQSGTDVLIQIDMATGAHVPNAFGAGIDYVPMPPVLGNSLTDDIAVDPTTGVLYAAVNSGGSTDRLITVNKTTGATTDVALITVPDIEGLGTDPTGQLWGTSGTQRILYELDKATGIGSNGRPINNGSDYEAVDCYAFSPSVIADLAVTKIVDDAAPAEGANTTYTVTATNTGPGIATVVQLSDVLPAGVTFASAIVSQGTYNSITGEWFVGTLNAGGNATLNLQASVDIGSSGSTITNTASVTFVSQYDPNAGNDVASADIVPIVLPANLLVLKSVSTVRDPLGATAPAALAIPGAVVQYEVSVSNSGGGAATETIVTDTLNSNLTFLAGEFDGGAADIEIIVGAAAPVYCIAEVGGDTNTDGCFLNAAGDDLTVTIPVSGSYPTGLTVGTTAPDNVVVVHFRATVN